MAIVVTCWTRDNRLCERDLIFIVIKLETTAAEGGGVSDEARCDVSSTNGRGECSAVASWIHLAEVYIHHINIFC